ncbi:DUF86 domain-containing protein [candidate division WOR-3 bacterium]|nr:DUF86 domain-containing protein [candidate division WOR-3 bacterium]
MKRDYKLLIEDILDSMNKIESFIGAMSFDEFMKDEKTKSAVVREIEVIGEATKNIPETIRKRYGNLPWVDMARTRDKIIHFYFGVDYDIVWRVMKERLPELKTSFEKILKEMEE